MNEHTLHDPQLQSLEARLAATPLQLPAVEQQQLLYRCAWEAGKKTAGRSLRLWQAATAALVVLLLGMSIPLARDEWLLAALRTPLPVPVEQPHPPVETTPPATLAQDLVPFRTHHSKVLELDAWQLPVPKHSFAEEMAQLASSDPHLRSLTMGTLSREILNP
jgi:hypothetical protein